MSSTLHVSFVAADSGLWRVRSVTPIIGETLAPAARIDVREGAIATPEAVSAAWILRGVTSHPRYVTAVERDGLRAVQAGLGRPEATHAALIPMTKSDAWWALAQDERRAIFEERSHHVAGTLKYLPAIARRLHHSRELGEPFDFLTWFEYAPAHDALFDELVGLLRATEEWKYVVREVDLRLERVAP